MAPRVPQALENSFDAVDTWICDSLVPQDAGLISTLTANASAGLDEIDVAPNQGKFLYLLAKMNSIKNYLEVGTLGGYSALWVAKALPKNGKIVTLELDSEHAKVAESNFKNANFGKMVEVKVGPALESLKKMHEEGVKEPFDMVFIDADKENHPAYFQYALMFARKGTVIVLDNMVAGGRLIDVRDSTPGVVGPRRLLEMLKAERRVECTALQTVGSKGWDGFAIALVVE